MPELKFKRVLVKMSGESLLGEDPYGISKDALDTLSDQILEVAKTGVQLAIVLGGGNIFRGMKAAARSGMDRAVADHMGMLATIMNALAVQDALERKGQDTRTMTAFPINVVAEPYIRRRAMHHLDHGRIVILAGGTGHPYFTTDTAAALRAVELNCEVLMKGTKVDGVYDKDPMEHDDAKFFKCLDYTRFLSLDLGVMDATAVSLCRSCSLPIFVFDLSEPGNIIKALYGESVGTRIGEV